MEIGDEDDDGTDVPESMLQADGATIKLPAVNKVHTVVLRNIIIGRTQRNAPYDIWHLLTLYHDRYNTEDVLGIIPACNATTVYISHGPLVCTKENQDKGINAIRDAVRRQNIEAFALIDKRDVVEYDDSDAEMLQAIFFKSQISSMWTSNLKSVELRLPVTQMYNASFRIWYSNNKQAETRDIRVLIINDPVIRNMVFNQWLYNNTSLTHLQVSTTHPFGHQGGLGNFKCINTIKVVRWCILDTFEHDSMLKLINSVPSPRTVCLYFSLAHRFHPDLIKNLVFEIKAKHLIYECRFDLEDIEDNYQLKNLILDMIDAFETRNAFDESITLSLEVIVPEALKDKERLIDNVFEKIKLHILQSLHLKSSGLVSSPVVSYNLRIVSKNGDMKPVISNAQKHNQLKELLDPLGYYRSWDEDPKPLTWLNK